MPDDIHLIEVDEPDAGGIFQDGLYVNEPRDLVSGQVDLCDVAGNDKFRGGAHAGQEHLQLSGSSILGFIKDDEGVVQGSSAHKGQGSDLDDVVFEERKEFLGGKHVAQRVVKGLQIRVELLFQIAGQEAQVFACFHGGAGQDDALYLFVFQGPDGERDGGIGLAGTGRANGKNQVVLVTGLHQPALVGGPGADQHPVTAMNKHFGVMTFGLQRMVSVGGLQQQPDVLFGEPVELLEVKQQHPELLFKIKQIGFFTVSLYDVVADDDLHFGKSVAQDFQVLIIHPENIQGRAGFNRDYFLAHEKIIPLIRKSNQFQMAIITLTSDWGIRDHYAGSVKGAILSYYPEALIVDISHTIQPHNLNQAAFVVRNCYHSFPQGTIHILGICEEASIETPHTLVVYDGHYFIGADNGIFSLIFDEVPEQVIELDVLQDSDYFTFPGRDVFAKVACHIAQGKPIGELGHPKKGVRQKIAFRPVVDESAIRGKVIYIDNYENVYTNITEKLFKEVVKKRKFAITFNTRSNRITDIKKSYLDVPPGEMLALFTTSGHLQIAMRNANAGGLLGLKLDTAVTVELE